MKRIAAIALCCLSTISVMAEKTRTITINYKETGISIKGRAKGVHIDTDGKSVSVTSRTDDNIKYILTGSASDSEFVLDNISHQSIELQNLNLSSMSGCAIKIHSTKSTSLILSGSSILYNGIDRGDMADGGGSDAGPTSSTNQDNQKSQTNPKAVIYSKGKLTFSGEGSLSIHAQKQSGIASGKSVDIEGGQIYIEVDADAVYDSLDNDYKSSAGIKTGKNFNISGGTLEIDANGSGSKCIKVDGDAKFAGGTILAKANGINAGGFQFGIPGMPGMPPMRDSLMMRNSEPMMRQDIPMENRNGLMQDRNRPMQDGNITTPDRERPMPFGEDIQMPHGGGGPMQFGGGGPIPFGGGMQRASASAKCVKVDGDISVTGGDFTFISENHEAFESKGKMEISGGRLYAFSKADDAINSGLTMTISGGQVTAQSNRNDALDSNGNLQMSGGTVYAIGSMPPEEAIDANSEQGCRFYMTGGTLIAINGIERGSQLKPKSISPSGIHQNAIYAISDSVETKQIVFRTPNVQIRQFTIVSDKIDDNSAISELEDYPATDQSQLNSQAYILFLQ